MAVLLGAVGVPHYTKDGKLFTGPTHKDASGRLMTGRTHTANSQFLFHSKGGIDGVKFVPFSKDLNKQMELLIERKKRFDRAIRENRPDEVIKANQFAFMKKLEQVKSLTQK